MLAVASYQPSAMSASPPKRPRLSLQIKSPTEALTLGKSMTALRAGLDPSSPTTFNTLSNAYATAIKQSAPLNGVLNNSNDGKKGIRASKPTSLRLETSVPGDAHLHPSQRNLTPGPFSATYPETPSSAKDSSMTAHPNSGSSATAFTFTPPQSAGATDSTPKTFLFSANSSNSTPRSARHRTSWNRFHAPYTHPRSLRSILRNSPLPPRSSSATPVTPTRAAAKMAARAARRVGYNDPIEQTIVTNKYIKSHIDLLAEDSPQSPGDLETIEIPTLDIAMAYTGDETKDGGETPGPFEEMRRRMADSELETPGMRKRRHREKKRKWRWTIGGEGEDESPNDMTPTNEVLLTAVEKTLITSVWRGHSEELVTDSELSEVSEDSNQTL